MGPDRNWGGGEGGQGGEMTETMYAHVNKWIKNKQIKKLFVLLIVSSIMVLWWIFFQIVKHKCEHTHRYTHTDIYTDAHTHSFLYLNHLKLNKK
jgi:hypothetical protein